MKTALLLIAHGSRNAEANADLFHAAAEIRNREQFDFAEACFLEIASPSIDVGARNCVDAGARKIIMLPYFLSPGIHVAGDLRDYRARLADNFPAVEFVLAAPLGRHPFLIDIVLERAREAENLPRG